MPTGGFKITQPKGNYVGLVSNSSSSGTASSADIEVLDEGISLTATVASVDFVGAGVTATAAGDAVTVTIPGGGVTGPFIDPADYGAVGDDTTDDTAAFQALIDANENDGGTVWIDRHYKITGTLVVNPSAPVGDLHWLGPDGGIGWPNSLKGRIRMATANTTAFQITHSLSDAFATTFQNIHILGPGSASSGAGILAGANVDTLGCEIDGFYVGFDVGSMVYYSKNIRTKFHLNTRSNVRLASGGNNAEFIACTIQYGQYGIETGGCQSVKVIGGAIEQHSVAAVRANGGTNATGLYLAGVYFEQVDGVPDILLGDANVTYGTTISGCTHVKSSYSGTGWAVDAPNAQGLVYIGGSIDSSDAIRVNTSSTACTIIQPYLRNAGTVTIPAGSIYIRAGTTTLASAVGTAAHGASSELAPIDHGHALGGTVAGDLSGTLPNPTVAKINGVAVTGTPAVGDEIVATSSTTATWQTPATVPTLPPAHVHVDNLTFSGDGATTDFELPASPVDAFSVAAYVAGVRTAITVSGSILTNMNFAVAPVSGTDNIIVDIAAALV